MTEISSPHRQSATDKETQTYVREYLDDIGSPEMNEILPYDRQIMHDLPLLLSLEPLDVKPNPDNDPGLKESNIFLRKPKGWLPKTKQEAKWANDFKLRDSLERAAKSKDPATSFRSRHKAAEAIWADAVADTEAYNRVVVAKGTQLVPDVEALRSEQAALYAMADRLFARECLDKSVWPVQADYKKRRNHWRGFMLVAARTASDAALLNAFEAFSAEANARREFWRTRVNFLESIVGRFPVKDTVEKSEIPETKHIDVQEGEPAPTPKNKKVESVEEYFPKEIQEWLAERRQARAELIERLDQQGMPQAEKLERVNQAFPELEPLDSQWHKEYVRHAQMVVKQPPAGPKKDTTASKPGYRRKPGYDHEDDPSNPWHY